MYNPLVSVIIPIYNAEKYLKETLDSVIKQSYINIEILLINHFSTDDSITIINHYKDIDKRVKVIHLDINKGGPAYPRNIGIKNSNGEYIAFIDSDDIWFLNKLQLQIDFMKKNNINFSSTNAVNINEHSIDISSKSFILKYINKYRGKSTICDLIKYNFISTSSVIIKKNIILNFNEDTDFISVEDFYLWLNILKNKDVKYKYLDNKLLKYRLLKNSASQRTLIHKQKTKANICILKFILDNSYYKVINCFYKSIFKTIIINFFKN